MKEMNDYKNIYTNFVQIGEGSFGKIYKAKNRSTNEYRAIKIIDKEKIKKLLRKQYNKDDIDNEFKSYYKYFLNEIEYMKICCKDNINSVKLYDYYDTDTELAIVMELCDDSLQSILNKKINGFNKQEIYDIITQLNNTFKIMNKNHIIHRDIKLDNILVKYTDETKTKFIVKLTDYGLVGKQLVSFFIKILHNSFRYSSYNGS
jgi:calcium-dependent protein kinase